MWIIILHLPQMAVIYFPITSLTSVEKYTLHTVNLLISLLCAVPVQASTNDILSLATGIQK
jgi:hypothetical protein